MALKKGPWTAAEDAVLMEYVTKHGEGNWNAVQRNTGLARCGKSCRLRWTNHLRPNLKKGAFSPEEEKLILELHAQYGNKWARMATLVRIFSDNEIKNYWNTRIKRRQRQGLPLYSDSPDQSNTTGTPATLSTHSATSLPTTAATTNFEFYHQNHLPLSSLPPGPTYASKPFFDPNALSSSSSLPFAFHQPTPLHCTNPFRPKRYRSSTTTLMDQPLTTTTTTTSETTQLANIDLFSFPVQLNSSSSQIYQTPLDSSSVSGVSNPSPMFPTKLELPSDQFSHSIDSDINLIMEMNNPALESNSDLLGDLLLQAEAMASGQKSKKRNYLSFCEGNDLFNGIQGFDDLPLSSVCCSSTPGLKAKEEAPDLLTKSMNDLSTLLDAVPSSIQFPNWQNDSAAAEICSVQSSSSFSMPDDNFGLDMMKPLTSLFPITNTTNPNENPACYTWDTLPGLC